MTAKQPDYANTLTFLLRAGGHPHMGLLVDRQHDGMLGRVDVQADDVLELGGELGSVERLKVRMRCGWRSWAAQMRWTERKETPVWAIPRPVQWVASPGGWNR